MEEVPAFVWREEIANIADGLDELIEGPGSDAPEVGLEFREGHFDRVEIRTAGRQEQEVAPMGLSIRVAVSLLWVARLSRMTTDLVPVRGSEPFRCSYRRHPDPGLRRSPGVPRSHRRTGLRSRSGCPIAETARCL